MTQVDLLPQRMDQNLGKTSSRHVASDMDTIHLDGASVLKKRVNMHLPRGLPGKTSPTGNPRHLST